MAGFRDWFRSWLGVTTAATVAPAREMVINSVTVAEASASGSPVLNPFRVPRVPDFAPNPAKMALDSGSLLAPSGGGMDITSLYQWAVGGAFSEGLGFLGYAYLAELAQRPEYRRISEIYASEATRKGIKFTGDEERIDAIQAALRKHHVWAKLREVIEHDGFYGRGQIFIDVGDDANTARGRRELERPFDPKIKIKPGGLKGLRTVEPFWSYPGMYESGNPLAPDFYKPRQWFVMSTIVDSSRLLTFTGREMPDLLKPAYSFGGLSLSQMAKPYVDNWLRTRQSVSDLLHSFSTMVLATNMGTVLQGKPATNFFKRLELYTRTRDNRGIMAIDKETEELSNVSTPLGTLDKLQAQSQEQIASVTGIPLVILLGVTPSGLNASSDGEVRSFYATIKAYQERVLRDPLQKIVDMIQLDIDGQIDPDISFEFIDLWEMDEKDKAAIRKSDADMDVAYVGAGIVSNEEVRDRIVQDEDSPYFGIDLSAEAPEPPGMPGDEGDDGEDGDPIAADAEFDGSKHPRAANGQFGSGGGGKTASKPASKGKESDKDGKGSKGAGEKPGAPMVTASGKPIPSHVVEHVGREGVERLKQLIADKNSTAREILDLLSPLDAAATAAKPTVAHGETPTPEFYAGREYRDSETGAPMNIKQAQASLVKKAESYAGPGGVKRDKQARLLLGPPAAGKSTSAERIAEKYGYAIVDGDDAKKVIPEFAGGVGASAVHEESSDMAANVLDTMLDRGDNVILPLVGGSPGSIRKRIERLKLAGYNVTVDLVDVNKNEAARRMAGRALSSGRHISSSYFMSIGHAPRNTYETLKSEYPDLGFGRIDGNGGQQEENYIDARNHPNADIGTRLFDD